jgi:hypothetical protein
MSITYPISQKASFYPEKYGRETFLADAGQRSRAIKVRPADSSHRPEISRDGHKKATNLVGAVLYASLHKGGRSHNGTGQVIGRHTVIAARLRQGSAVSYVRQSCAS